jgi:predicted RNase H-like nuclease (RuvC/YqgF family)
MVGMLQTPQLHIDTSTWIAAGSLITALSVLLKTWYDKRKTDADADQSAAGSTLAISNAATVTVKFLTDQIKELGQENQLLRSKVANLECDVKRLRDIMDDMEQLRTAIRMLRQQIISMNRKPVVDLDDSGSQ